MSTDLRKYGFITFLLACLAALTFYMAFWRDSEQTLFHKNADSIEIDSILYKMCSTRFNKEGNIQSIFRAEKLIHYKKTNDSQFIKPKLILYSENAQKTKAKIPWVITAQLGKSLTGTHEILLQNEVKIHQNATSQHGDLTILTSQLHYYPDKQQIQTDAIVYLQQPGLKIQGRGLEADFLNEHLQLLHEAQSQYEPSSTPPSRRLQPNTPEKKPTEKLTDRKPLPSTADS